MAHVGIYCVAPTRPGLGNKCSPAIVTRGVGINKAVTHRAAKVQSSLSNMSPPRRLASTRDR